MTGKDPWSTFFLEMKFRTVARQNSVVFSRRSTIRALGLLAATTGAACGNVAETDSRVRSNPLLAELDQKTPNRLPGFLRELDTATKPRATPSNPADAPAAGALPVTEGEIAELRRNPDLDKAYRSNPDLMLQLLRRMLEAAKRKS